MEKISGISLNKDIILLFHTITQLGAMAAITVLVWHGAIQGEAGLVALLGAAGLHVAGTHAIMASGGGNNPPPQAGGG